MMADSWLILRPGILAWLPALKNHRLKHWGLEANFWQLLLVFFPLSVRWNKQNDLMWCTMNIFIPATIITVADFWHIRLQDWIGNKFPPWYLNCHWSVAANFLKLDLWNKHTPKNQNLMIKIKNRTVFNFQAFRWKYYNMSQIKLPHFYELSSKRKKVLLAVAYFGIIQSQTKVEINLPQRIWAVT